MPSAGGHAQVFSSVGDQERFVSLVMRRLFRDRIRGVYPPNSIPNLKNYNNELNAVRRRPRTNSYHPSETKNVLFSLVMRRFSRPSETVYTMTGPTGLRFSGSSAGKIRVRRYLSRAAARTPGLGLGQGIALATT